MSNFLKMFHNHQFIQNASESDAICHGIDKMIAAGRTRYHNYTIWKSKSLGECITIDGDLQSTEIDCATYHEALVHPAMILSGTPRRVLICGGGGGAAAREVMRYGTVEKVVMVDIDQEMVALLHEFFPHLNAGAFDDPRFRLVHQDITSFLAQTRDKFDVIISDLTDVLESKPGRPSFHTTDFYRLAADRLRPGGFFATQASALALFDFKTHRFIRESIFSVFGRAISYRAAVDSYFVPWSFILTGANDLPPLEKLPELFTEGFSTHCLDLDHFDPLSLTACFILNKRIRQALNLEAAPDSRTAGEFSKVRFLKKAAIQR